MGYKTVLMAVLACLVDFIILCKLWTKGTTLLFVSKWWVYPAFGSTPALNSHPSPIDAIHDIAGVKKTIYFKHQQ